MTEKRSTAPIELCEPPSSLSLYPYFSFPFSVRKVKEFSFQILILPLAKSTTQTASSLFSFQTIPVLKLQNAQPSMCAYMLRNRYKTVKYSDDGETKSILLGKPRNFTFTVPVNDALVVVDAVY